MTDLLPDVKVAPPNRVENETGLSYIVLIQFEKPSNVLIVVHVTAWTKVAPLVADFVTWLQVGEIIIIFIPFFHFSKSFH